MSSGPLNPWSGDGQAGFHIYCPGCKSPHSIRTAGPTAWGFDGNLQAPTFTPSLLVTWKEPSEVEGEFDDPSKDVPQVCHSFITAGQIQFLGDCTHALAGQTVPLPPYPESWK